MASNEHESESPATHLAEEGDHLALLPDISRRTRRFLGPLNGLLVDG